MTGALNDVISADVIRMYDDRQAHALARDAADAEVRSNEREGEKLKTERANLIDLEDADAALRYVDGEAAAPEKPNRKKRLATLNSKIPVMESAKPLLKARAVERRAEFEASQLPFTRAVLDAVNEVQAPLLKRLRDGLAALETDLCDLAATDAILRSLAGDRFPMPDGCKAPVSGSIIMRKLVAAIPERLRPPALNIERLETRSRAAAAVVVHSLKENAK